MTVTFNYADGGNETVTLEDLEKERNTSEGSNVFRLAGEEGLIPFFAYWRGLFGVSPFVPHYVFFQAISTAIRCTIFWT